MSTAQSPITKQQNPFFSGASSLQALNFGSHISLPSGISLEPMDAANERSKQFTQSLRNFAVSHSGLASMPNNASSDNLTSEELSFGAPQIDLALPRGTLATNALHEINPVCHRDQQPALTIALALAARNHNQKSGVILCFLLEQQAKDNKALSERSLGSIGIGGNDLIVITAKHKDDLLWAMEEALHNETCSTVVAHLPVIDDPQKQRLSFIAKSNNVPAILICNHKSSLKPLGLTTWSVEVSEDGENKSNHTTTLLTLTNNQLHMPVLKWSIKWNSEKDKFHAVLIGERDIRTPENTIH